MFLSGGERGDMYRKILIMLAAAGVGVSVAACSSTAPGQGAASQQVAQPAAAGTSAAGSRSGAVESAAVRRSSSPTASLRLLIEPGSGIGPIYKLITGARSSVDLTMYELADPTAEADLAADAARGVDVRVILDQHLEKSANTAAYDYLTARGVHVRWAPAGTTYHQKTLTVDDATSVIMTLNLVAQDYPGTRDFAVIDTGRADVAAIVATFNADFAGRAITPPDGADLVWSPTNAKASVLSVIDGATHTLAVEDEEMDDPAVTAALAAAARRGVDVTITMTADPRMGCRPSPNWPGPVRTSGSTPTGQRPVHPRQGHRRRRRAVRPAGAGGIAELLRGQPRLQPGTRHPHQRRALVAAISATLAGDYAGAAPYSPPPASRSGAWCTATASVYNAADDENNVYVHSNQPDQDATATADGYSHSYQTNGSGYALIYLNGPPPGARITVTVGGATCTTSD